jgi:enamine deaminase RidA (YjgF/YER057c/UK114 family)
MGRDDRDGDSFTRSDAGIQTLPSRIPAMPRYDGAAGPRWRARHHRQEDAMAAKTRFINPERLVRSPAYTQVVEVVSPGRTIYISGQLGTDRDGKLAAGEFRAQAEQVYQNLQAALASIGASFADVVKLNSYLAQIAHLPILREVRARYLDPAALPASTTIAVTGFAREGALLEIEAVAALPSGAARTRPSGAKRAARAGKLKSARRTGR